MSARMFALAAAAAALGLAGGVAYERLGRDGPQSGEKKIAYWVAPMDPNYRRDAPGKSPMGMDLIPVYEGEEPGSAKMQDENVVRVSPAAINNMGVRTAAAEKVDFTTEIRTIGLVEANEDRTSHVHVRKDGWIERLAVRSLGAEVKKGDLLFEYFSQELAATSSEFVRDLERGNGNMSSGGAQKLRALGVSEPQIAEIAASRKPAHRFRVPAPQDGVIAQLNVGEGMYIRPDQTIMTLTDLSSIWVVAEVLESASDRVFPGMEAEARLQHLPNDVWRGKVDYIYPELNETARTLRVRLRFPNPGLKLRPKMFAEIVLKGKTRPGVLSVPTEAVIRTGRSDRVVLALGEGRFKSVPVKIGAQHQGRTEILSGLDEGAQVTVSGQFLIDSEAGLKAGFDRMEAGEPAAAPAAASDNDAPVWGEGVVDAVKDDGRVFAMSHGPIPALGWPPMSMDLPVAEGAGQAGIVAGAKIRFALAKDSEGMFQIVKVEPAP